MERELWEEEELEAGDYLCYVEVDWNQDEVKEITLSAYSWYEVHFIRDERDDYPEFLENVYASCAIKYGEKTNFKNEGAPGCMKYSKMMPEGYGFNYFKNDSIEGSLREVVSYTWFTGIELVKPFKNSGYEVLVPPKQSKIVLLR